VIQLDLCNLTEVSKSGRDQWREVVLKDLFSYHMTSVLDSLKKTAGIPSSILWENVAVRINSVYRKLEAKELDSVKTDWLRKDFTFLKNATGDLFGLKGNPIQGYLKIGEELLTNPNRQTCCMYHKLKEDPEGIGYCNNCPIA
jgi:ferric iron reductase protein FhuF